MKLSRKLCLILLLTIIPISIVMADINVTWVRKGIVLESETKNDFETIDGIEIGQQDGVLEIVESIKIDDKRILLRSTWQAGKTYAIHVGKKTINATSPLKPQPYVLHKIELDGLLSLLENLRQPAKPTAIAFGNRTDMLKLAIATDRGHVALLKSVTGETIWKTRISEGYVRQITFSADDSLLYAGEQATDGFVYCYELASDPPKLRWKYRTADDIETSTPNDPDSVYAWVSYPGQSCMKALPNGDLLVSGVHSWTKENKQEKRSILYRFDSQSGQLKWKYPNEGPIDKIYRWFDVSDNGKTLALLTDDSGNGNGMLTVIDVETGTEEWSTKIEPLTPYFKGVTFWRGVSMSPNGKSINVTTDDGRAFIFDVENSEPIWQEKLASPLEVSGVPIIATTGTIGSTDTHALFVTGDTYIPYHLQKGAQRPSTMHPNGMTLFAFSWTGVKKWQWKLENMPQGLRIDRQDRFAALGVSKRSKNPKESLHGVSVFDLTADGGGISKYLFTYRTEGQLPYDTLAISSDGLVIAIVEIPISLPDDTQLGKNQIHLLY
ncbi:PQQ-like beta-propeller repeat protein [Candidatus Poribacteria bacterium]|nr:PQQ-like beta-propeller repeat protein [Candidatus Poribacteria bacterium]